MKLKQILGDTIYNFLYKHYITWSVRNTIAHIDKKQGNFNATEAVEFLFSPKARHIKPMQHREEVLELAKRIYERQPRTILEIGTARGGTLFLSSQLSHPEALIVSIDLPGGMYGGGYPEWKIPLYKRFRKKRQKIELIQGDSHTAEVLNKLKALLNGKTIDYLFIDGDHTYEGVRQDFETYSQLLSAESMVAFHDIVIDRSEIPNHFVHEYWQEIRNKYQHEEIIANRDQSKLGIGILYLK